MAFLILYPTSQADFNYTQERKVNLNNYAHYIMCYYNRRFRRHPCQRFLIFNLLMCQKASNLAHFYVSKVLGLKDLNCEELTEALQTDKSLLPQIVHQGSMLTSTCLFQRNKSIGLQAQACFLTPSMSPIFVTFSVANMQQEDLHWHFPGFLAMATGDNHIQR